MSDAGRILVMEANVLVRHPLAEYLRECGYNVAEARDVEEAKTLLSANELPVDVVLAEGDTGFALASWIRANNMQIRIILAGTVPRATEKAADLCNEGPALTMPYEHKLVLERIRQLTARAQ